MESPSEQPERLVQFSPRARVQLENLIEQLRANWSAAVVTNFLSLLARRLHQVSLSPVPVRHPAGSPISASA